MQQTRRPGYAWSSWGVIRRRLPATALGGWGMLLAGCVAVAGLGGGIAAVLLSGFFLGAVQASFAATARSYGFTDRGNAQFVFYQQGNPNSNVDLSRFIGRLPGFHIVIINIDNDKTARDSWQAQPVLYETDVEIHFDTLPATLTGTISEVDGDGQFDLFELYPQIDSPTLSVTPDGTGGYDVRITVVAHSAEGDLLEYGFVWHARLSSSGLSLEGDVEVVRELTPVEGDPIVIEGAGSLTAARVADS
jgi:hypothetical protein